MIETGWQFRDRSLRDAACASGSVEFQRLELLGDAIADAILLPWLYHWSTGSVAVLAGARQQLTSDATLDHLSVLTGLHDALPSQHRGSAGHRADHVEAVLGAAYLDGGWPAATTVCETVFGAWLDEPAGVAQTAARIDTVVDRHQGSWRWRCLVWLSGADAPMIESGVDDDPVCAEILAITNGLLRVGRDRTTVWIEVSDELRSEVASLHRSEHADELRELRALLATFDGVWFVPSERIDTTLDPWGSTIGADGTFTAFEARLGHDLVRPALERLALHPGNEQRRLAFVGIGVLKSAAALRAYHRSPAHGVGELHDSVAAEVALDRLHRAAFAVGLVDLLFPGTRPVDPVVLIRAALGATAVDAGPEQAVALADDWLDEVRISGVAIDHLSAIEANLGGERGGPRHVGVSLVTPDSEAHWHLDEDGISLHALAVEGICAAVDCIDPSHPSQPILVGAPTGVIRAVDAGGTSGRDPALDVAIGRFLARIDHLGIQVIWHGPVTGSSTPPAPSR